MKRSYIPFALSLAALLAAAGAGLFCPPVRSWAAGMFMLFQQRSAHVLLGYISGSGHPALATVLLSAWQSAFLPWQPCRAAVAAAAAMGPAAAILLCLIGRALACGLWYLLVRGLFCPFAKKTWGRRSLAPAAALGLFFPGWTAPLAAVPGALAAPVGPALLLMVLAAAPQLILTARLCSLMSAALASPWRWVSPGLGVIAALAAVLPAGRAKGRSRPS